MSYHIYTTDAIILKRTPIGEANAYFHILTEDFGLIIASAQAVRKSISKLRPALQEYSLVSISCVKGKNGWKVTNVVEKNNLFFSVPVFARHVMAQVVSVILKMIPGEASHPEIFQTVRTGFEFLVSVANQSAEARAKAERDIPNFECLIVLRILYHLGYVVWGDHTKEFLKNTQEWNDDILNNISVQKKEVIALINKALEASQL